MITMTSYGTWLPGDIRGSINKGILLPPRPALERHARRLLRSPPVVFSDHEQDVLARSLDTTATLYDYPLEAVAIEATHCHVLTHPRDDTVAAMVGRLKTAMRQSLQRGRIWTRGYNVRRCYSEQQVDAMRAYIAHHPGYRP